MSQQTQTAAIRGHLEAGRTITFLEALRDYGVMHLPRRILDLKESGYPIADRWVEVPKADGTVARVKEWRKA